MEFFVMLAALPFITGLMSTRWQTILIWPAVSLAFWAWQVATEPSNYDMHGFGNYIGAVGAVVSVLAWLAGATLRSMLHDEHPDDSA